MADNSVVMAWAFEDELTGYAERVLASLADARGVVPQIWPLEVANVLVIAERRGRISETESARFLALLAALPLEVARDVGLSTIRGACARARDCGLSAYDASYLGLAIDRGFPLATQDRRLRAAATAAGVPLWMS